MKSCAIKQDMHGHLVTFHYITFAITLGALIVAQPSHCWVYSCDKVTENMLEDM